MKQRNYYKLKKRGKGMVRRGEVTKRGQLAIFVIVAIVIVAVIILVVVFYPKIKSTVTGEFTPENYLKTCISPEIKSDMSILNQQGGYANPEGFIVYNEQKVKFLCYTSEYYKTCMVQEPMITSRYEQELNKAVGTKAKQCFADLKSEYEKRGYSVIGNLNDVKTEIEPNDIKMTFSTGLTVTKGSTEKFDNVEVKTDSQVFEILSIVQSIVEFESTYGDSETTTYLQYYPDVKIEKIKMSDGTKIYKVSNVLTKEEFVFGSRSLSWPPGYGVLK